MYLLDAVFFLVRAVLDLLWWAVLLAAVVQTLIAFNVLDTVLAGTEGPAA